MTPTICVTGNIASGKTTCAELLATQFPNACCVPEPHLANPFLPLYLKDKPRWGFTAQLRYFRDYALLYHQIISQGAYDYHFVDAGIWTNRMVYVAYLRQEQIITEDEYAFYQELCDTIQQAQSIPEPAAYIFVEAAPQLCWDRMKRRGWDYQVGAVDLAYIEALDTMLRKMKQTVAATSTPVLELSSETLNFTTPSGQGETLGRVQRFLDAHQLLHP
jgi:deoxyadenosine/deoxycytidine kinase